MGRNKKKLKSVPSGMESLRNNFPYLIPDGTKYPLLEFATHIKSLTGRNVVSIKHGRPRAISNRTIKTNATRQTIIVNLFCRSGQETLQNDIQIAANLVC